MKLLTLKEVIEKTSFKKSTIYKFIKTKNFPSPVKFGHSSRWVESEIDNWIKQQIFKGEYNVTTK